MAETAARLAISARRNEVARFTIVVTGIDLTNVAMAMQIRLGRDVPGAPRIALATVNTLAAEGLKLDSVTVTNGVPVSIIRGRINASTMTDPEKVPYTAQVGADSVLAYAMQWTLNGDAQTRLYGDFIVLASAFGSDNAPSNRYASYGGPISVSGGSSGASLQFGDQIVQVNINGIEVLAPLIANAGSSAGRAEDARDRAEAAARKANPEGFVNGDVRLALAVDADGYATAWFDADGALHAKLADGVVQGDAVMVFTGDISAGFVDMDGYVAGALNASGSPVNVSGPFVTRLVGADGARDIVLTDSSGSAYLTYGEGDSTTPTIQGDQIAWLRGAAMKSRDISARAVVSAGVSTIAMIAVYGQSNSVGGDPGPIGLDRVPLDPGRGIMFPGGIVPARYGELVTEVDLGQMVDLSGPARDNLPAIGPRIVRGYVGALPPTQAVAYASSGVRGLRYDQLKPGSPFWANLIRTIVVAKLQAWRAGLAFTVDAMPYVQGESDFATATTASYKANLFEMRDAFRIAVRAITFSATAAPPILIVQPSSWTSAAYKLTTAQVPLAQMAAMADDAASFAVVGPMYPLTYMADGLHPDAEGQRRMDEMIGDGLARMARGAGAAGLYVTKAVRNGVTITATCRLPEGGTLAIDTALVSNPGQLGVRYLKADGSEVVISNIAVNGATITLSLAQAVAGTLRFGLDGTAGQPAGPTTGARCCIRDTFAAASANGQPRYNWMLHHAIGVA